jgi:hypothetical protein
MIFFGAGYFGAVWTHYFADEPPQQQTPGEVSVKILPSSTIGNRLCDPKTRKCSSAPASTIPKPHD